MTVRVPAKVNLQLAVGAVRPAGYHNVVTVYHAVSLFDEVSVTAAERDSVAVSEEGPTACRRTACVLPGSCGNRTCEVSSPLRMWKLQELHRPSSGGTFRVDAPECAPIYTVDRG
jgi:hypothetical protein